MTMNRWVMALALLTLAAAPGRAHAPLPVGGIGQWFGADAYPPDAMRAHEQGRVGVRVNVDETGKPINCAVASSSGSFALDSGTCTIAMANMTFTPATDAEGKPVAGVYPFAVRWQIPKDLHDQPAPAPPEAAKAPAP